MFYSLMLGVGSQKLMNKRLICASSRPDVICVLETWLCDEITDSEIAIPNFCVTRWIETDVGMGLLFM